MHQIGIKLFSSSGGGEAPPSPTDGSAGAPPPPPPPPGPSFGGQSSEPTPLLDRNMSKEEWDYETYESDPSSFPTEVAPHILVAPFLAFEAKISFSFKSGRSTFQEHTPHMITTARVQKTS